MASTPLNCLHHAFDEMPSLIRHKFCLKFKAHLLSFSDHPALSLLEDCWQERFPDSPGFCSYNMFTKVAVDHSLFAAAPLRIPNLPHWSLQKPLVDPALWQFVHQTTSAFVVLLFWSHWHNIYDQCVKIYTDGSKTSTRTVCGTYIADKNLKYSIAINNFSSSITSELFTILHALYLVYSLKIVKVIIDTDSLSSLQSITNWNWKNIVSQTKSHSFVRHLQLRATRSVFFGFLATKISQETKWLINWRN